MKKQPAFSHAFASGLTAALCATSFALLMAAVVLGEWRQTQQQAQHGWSLLRSDVHRSLDRPNLLEPALFDDLEIASRDALALEKRLRGGTFAVADINWLSDLETVSGTLHNLSRLRSGFNELGESSDAGAAPGSTLSGASPPGSGFNEFGEPSDAGAAPDSALSVVSLPDLCGRDASVANMPRLRQLLDERMARGNEVGLGLVPELVADADAPRLQKALLLADQFRTLRGQALGLMDNPNLRSPLAIGPEWPRRLAGGGALAAFLALLCWRVGVRRAYVTPRPALPVPLSAPTEPHIAHQVEVIKADAVAPSVAVAPVLTEPPYGLWMEIGLNLGQALEFSGRLEAQSLALIDGAHHGAHVTRDEAVTALIALAGQLRAAREATVNTGLSVLAGMDIHERVTEFGRLDQQLQAILEVVQRLQALHATETALADSTSVVKRQELIRLHTELGHLSLQLAVLHEDVHSTVAISQAG